MRWPLCFLPFHPRYPSLQCLFSQELICLSEILVNQPQIFIQPLPAEGSSIGQGSLGPLFTAMSPI